ncbi:MAG: hypothetical protein QXP57_08780 [Nitrososphaerota archaeon]
MVVKQLIAFIIGGAVTVFIIGPIMITVIPLLLILLLGLMVASFLIPGGWFISWLAMRTASLPLHFKIGRLVFGLFLIALGAFFIGLAFGYVAQQAFLFLSGGIVTMLSFTPPSFMARQKIRRRQTTPEVKIDKLKTDSMIGKALSMEELRNGVLIVGERCIDIARALIKNIVDNGLRVVVIGTSSKIIPEGVKARGGIADKIDVVGDMLNDHRCIESFTYAYSLANRLRNDDIPLLMNACMDSLLEVQSGKLGVEEFLKTLPDKIQDRRASLIKALINITDWFSQEGLKMTEADGEWQVLYISVKNLEYRHAVFAIAYSILTLNLDAVLVIHSPELLMKDVNLLAYDSREPWERLFNALDEWRLRGLVLVSKSPILSEQVIRLCQTHIASKMSEYFRPLDDRTRQIYEVAKTLNGDEIALYNSKGLFKIKLKNIPEPANIPPPKKKTTVTVSGEGGEVEEVRGEEKKIEPTLLEKMFGDRVIDVARILEEARNGLSNVSEKDRELVRELEEKGFITSLGGVYYTSSTGEESLSEYQKAVRERGLLAKPVLEKVEEKIEEKIQESRQTVIDSEASSRIYEYMATYYMAESLFRQGKYAQSIMNCYEFMVNALKKFYEIEKGHLDDIVEMLSKKGAETGITVQEARDAKTLLIEASKSIKEGRQVSITSAQRMLKYARKVLESLSRIGGDAREV